MFSEVNVFHVFIVIIHKFLFSVSIFYLSRISFARECMPLFVSV